MLDDLRNHDASPSAEEREWLATDPFTVVLRGIAIAGVAVILGLTASHLLADAPAASTIAANTAP